MDSIEASIIDVHGHCVPRGLLDDLIGREHGPVSVDRRAEAYVVRFADFAPLRPVSGVMLDGAERQHWLDQQRVELQFVAPWLDLYGQELPAADGSRWIVQLNDRMAQLARSSNGRLRAHAALHLADVPKGAAELRRAVSELGMTSVMIPSTIPGRGLGDRSFDELWAAAAELDVMVLLHATTGSDALKLLDRYPGLQGLFGRNIEVALSAAEMIVAGVLDRHPDLRLLVVHGGGFLPYLAGRFDNDARRHGWPGTLPSEAMRSLYYDTVLLAPAAVDCLCAVAGSGRVMLGSDFGSTPTERESLGIADAVLQSALDDHQRAAILRENAARSFRLG